MQNMKQFGLWLVMVLTATAAMAATPGELTVEPPTLHCAGFHWEVGDDGNNNATATIEFRKAGASEWRKGMDFMRLQADGREWVAGSLFGLEPGTDYEAKLSLVDPDGVSGEAEKTVTFKTRTEPVKPEGGTTYHVYPEGQSGDEAPLLGKDGDWRAALADASTLKPGDRVQFHAGEYSLSPNIGKVATKDVGDVSTADLPTMPDDGTVWHAYPANYKGERQEPALHRSWASQIWGRDGKTDLSPGDTVLFHAGVYKLNKKNYREPAVTAPGWGTHRIWIAGEAGWPIRLKAAGDGEVVFDGDGNWSVFDMGISRHIWLDGLTIRNAHCGVMAGMSPFRAAENLTITNCTFQDVKMALYNDHMSKNWHIAGNQGVDSMHAGPWHEAFGTVRIASQGTSDKPVVLESAGDGEVVFDGNENWALLEVLGSEHLWLDGLSMTRTEAGILAAYCPYNSADGLIVTKCKITDIRNGIYDDEARNSENFYIADNYIMGRTTGGMNDHNSPFGIAVSGRGHVVCYNHVENFQDAIDTGWDKYHESIADGDYQASMDISNNVMIHGSDDLIEMDEGMFNIRALRNFMINSRSGAMALSMQGGPGGPYYWFYNVAFKSNPSAFKLPRNMLVAHNTITSLNAGHNDLGNNLHLRNNIFISYPDSYKERNYGQYKLISFRSRPPVNTSDYNAHRLLPEIHSEKPYAVAKDYWATLEEYAEATGLEKHSILVDGFGIFRTVPDVPERGPVYNMNELDFRVADDAPTIDAGVVLPNINDDYTGEAPDIGAYEAGKPVPHYGPRK